MVLFCVSYPRSNASCSPTGQSVYVNIIRNILYTRLVYSIIYTCVMSCGLSDVFKRHSGGEFPGTLHFYVYIQENEYDEQHVRTKVRGRVQERVLCELNYYCRGSLVLLI